MDRGFIWQLNRSRIMDADRFVIADREGFGGDVCLRDIRIRRCVGCVTCLTEHPGSCKIEDGFTDLLGEILDHEELVVSIEPEHGTVPDIVRKTMERLSNILDAYTECGGNEPIPADKVKLRRIVFECRGKFADRMESEMTGALRMGPVSDVIFIQKQRS